MLSIYNEKFAGKVATRCVHGFLDIIRKNSNISLRAYSRVRIATHGSRALCAKPYGSGFIYLGIERDGEHIKFMSVEAMRVLWNEMRGKQSVPITNAQAAVEANEVVKDSASELIELTAELERLTYWSEARGIRVATPRNATRVRWLRKRMADLAA